MGKKKKKSKKNYGFEDEEEPPPEPVEKKSGFDGFEDVVEDEMQMTGKKKKKKKKKKKNTGFMDEYDKTPDEDEEDENDRFKKKTKKAMSKKDIRESQMNQTKAEIKRKQLQEQEAREREMKLEQERKKLVSLNKSRSRKKKKGGFSSFQMMVQYSDSEPEEEEEKEPPKPRTPTPPPVKKRKPSPPAKFKKKKGRGKKGRKQQKEVEEEDLDALLAGFNQGSAGASGAATEELKIEEVKKEPEPAASTMPAWALEFDEDDMMIFKKMLGKAKDLKTAKRKLGAGLDLEDEQVEEAWAMKDQILAKKAAPPPPPKEPTPPPAPKVDLKKKRKREEQKRKQKLKKIRPRLDGSKSALNEEVKRIVTNMFKHYVTFIDDPENGFTMDVHGVLLEVIAPFKGQIEETFDEAQSVVKGDGVLFDESYKKLEGLLKGKERWNSYKKMAQERWKSLEAEIKAAIEAWREEEKRIRLEREERERLEKERLKQYKKEQKKKKEAEKKRLQAEQRRKDFEARFKVRGRGGGAGRGRVKKKKSKFALAREEEIRRQKEISDRIQQEKEERERKRKEEEEKAKLLEEEKKRAEEEAAAKRIADLKKYVQKRKKPRKKDSDDSDDSDSLGSSSDDSDEVKPKKKKKKPASSSDDESESKDGSVSSSKLDSESESESESKSSSEEDFSDASDDSVVEPVKPPPKPKPKPKPQISSSPSTKESPRKAEGKDESKKTKKKGKKKLSKKEKRLLKEQKQKERLKNLRAPIGCIMGHVDAGKTLILDNIRKSKVAEGESGGITQQIGATFLPRTRLQEHLEKCRKTFKDLQFHLPGILMIDTPGHAAFHNMRTRGSNLCDIAIVAVDIFDADRSKLQPTTIEALKMLKSKKTPFVIAMNKIDMINGWEKHEDESFTASYSKQSARVKQLLEGYLSKVKLRFAEEGFNVEIYSRNKNKNEYISLVPTSAFTGEGIADILCLLSELCQTYMAKGLQFVSDKVRGSVLETKKMVGIGNVCDVILANGELRAGDEIVLGGLNGAFCTKIKSILLPSTLQEMRVKGEYKTVPSVTAAAGVRIQAANLENALAGSKILVVGRELKKEDKENEIDRLLDQVDGEMETLAYDYIDPSGVGVFLQANTLGAMEALLEIVKEECDIPISGIRLGDISKADVMKASVANEKGRPEYACILGFMVQCPRDVQLQAEASRVTIFQSDVIYRLQLQFQEYLEDMLEQRKLENADEVVFPVEMEILPKYIIHAKKPVVLGCRILRGMLRIGTPVISMQHDSNGRPAPFLVGKVDSIQKEQKDIEKGDVGDEVAVRFNSGASDVVVTYGRHFDHKDKLVSAITRGSLDKLKDLHADEIKDDQDCIKLIHLLKNYFDII